MSTRPHDPWLNENEQAVRDVLKRFTYRPGWKFSVDSGLLRVYMTVTDANPPHGEMDLTFSQPIPPHIYEGFDWIRWLYDQLRTVEMHELQEFFRIDGRVVFDPHPELLMEKINAKI